MLVRFGVAFCFSVFLSGCGGGSSSTGGSTPETSGQNQAPTPNLFENLSLLVNFPPDGSLSAQSSVAFSGRVEGLTSNADSSDLQVRVRSDDSSILTGLTGETWTVEGVSIAASVEPYEVELLVNDEVVASQTLQLSFDEGFYPFGVGDALTLNETSNTAYLLDGGQILQIDMLSGTRSFLLDLSSALSDPTDVIWLSASERLLVVDADGSASLVGPSAFGWGVLEQINGLDARTIGLDSSGAAILAYESNTHMLKIYNADFSVAEEFSLPEALATVDQLTYLNTDDVLLVGGSDLVVFNLITEVTTSFSLEDLNLGSIDAMEADASGNQVFLRSASTNELWQLDLDWSDTPGYTAQLIDLGEITAYAIAFSSAQDRLLVSSPNQLSAYNVAQDSVTAISQLGWGDGASWMAPASLALDEQGRFAYVSDLAADDIYQVDLNTGHRTALNTSGESMEAVTGMVQDGENLYSVDWVKKSVLMTNVDTGLTSDLIVDTLSQPDLSEPIAIDLDAGRFRAFVLDRGLRAIYEVDTASGNALVVASSGDVDALTLAKDLSLDEPNQAIYWSSWLDNSLHRLNLNSLESDLISGRARGEGDDFGRPGSIALDVSQSVAYVSDALDGKIFAVELDSGARRVISDSALLSKPESIAFDSVRGVLNILDSDTRALYALDPGSGSLVLISM